MITHQIPSTPIDAASRTQAITIRGFMNTARYGWRSRLTSPSISPDNPPELPRHYSPEFTTGFCYNLLMTPADNLVLNRQAVRELDRVAIEDFAIPGIA